MFQTSGNYEITQQVLFLFEEHGSRLLNLALEKLRRLLENLEFSNSKKVEDTRKRMFSIVILCKHF
jgi:hypothetical protein